MATDEQIEAANKKVSAEVERRKRTTRNFPASPFEEAFAFAKQVFDFGSGQPVRRLSIFDHIGKSPESGPSRQLITNANKYGLIKGGYQAEVLELTPDALKSLDLDFSPRERARAKVRLAVEEIDPFKKLYDRFVGKTLPAKAALVDAVKEFDVSHEASEEAVDTFIVNLRYVGLLAVLSGAERVISLDHLLDSIPATLGSMSEDGSRANRDSSSLSAQSLVTGEHAKFESTCFYITPIGEDGSIERKHSDLFLGSFIEPALEAFKMSVIRADKIDKPGMITRQIIEYIVKSRLVIVDLSFNNPNVFYELALRHLMRMPIVQIIRIGDKIPFDINQMRTIVIDTSDIYTLLPRVDTYRAEIATQVRRALESPDAVDTPISTYFPDLRASFG